MVWFGCEHSGRSLCVQHILLTSRRMSTLVWFCSLSIYEHKWSRRILPQQRVPNGSDMVDTPSMTDCTTLSIDLLTEARHDGKHHVYRGKTNSTRRFWKHSSKIIALDKIASPTRPEAIDTIFCIYFFYVPDERITASFPGPNLELMMGKFLC